MKNHFYKFTTFALLIILVSFAVYEYHFAEINKTKADDKSNIEWVELGGGGLPSGYLCDNGAYNNCGFLLADVNGDGLVDMVNTIKQEQNVFINTGINGNLGYFWRLDKNYIVPQFYRQPTGHDIGVRMADINNDGLADFMQAWTDNNGKTTTAVYINKGDGTGWELQEDISVPHDFVFVRHSFTTATMIADINGDGIPDLLDWTDYMTPDKVYLGQVKE